MSDFFAKGNKPINGIGSALTALKKDLTDLNLSGTTNQSGGVIKSGYYFYLNGTLVRAKADIASGATFTLNTNYEVVSAGALNDLKSEDYLFEETYSMTQSVWNDKPLPIGNLGGNYTIVSVCIQGSSGFASDEWYYDSTNFMYRIKNNTFGVYSASVPSWGTTLKVRALLRKIS